jgi:hypothetical protein
LKFKVSGGDSNTIAHTESLYACASRVHSIDIPVRLHALLKFRDIVWHFGDRQQRANTDLSRFEGVTAHADHKACSNRLVIQCITCAEHPVLPVRLEKKIRDTVCHFEQGKNVFDPSSELVQFKASTE